MQSCLFWECEWENSLELYKHDADFLSARKSCKPSVPRFSINKKGVDFLYEAKLAIYFRRPALGLHTCLDG